MGGIGAAAVAAGRGSGGSGGPGGQMQAAKARATDTPAAAAEGGEGGEGSVVWTVIVRVRAHVKQIARAHALNHTLRARDNYGDGVTRSRQGSLVTRVVD